MNQTWDDQREQQDDYLRLLRRMKGEGYTPHSQVRVFRRRFYLSLALNVLLLVLWLLSLRGKS